MIVTLITNEQKIELFYKNGELTMHCLNHGKLTHEEIYDVNAMKTCLANAKRKGEVIRWSRFEGKDYNLIGKNRLEIESKKGSCFDEKVMNWLLEN